MYTHWKSFDFVTSGSTTLVVTIGESWTWGDSLGKTKHTIYDDKKFRLANVYGGQLANMINADFLNIAAPGQSNLWISTHFKLLMDNIDQFQYNNIIVILTLTEVGREFNGDLDQQRDYMTALKDISNLDSFLHILSSYITKDILSVDTTNIKLLVGTNFIDSNYSPSLNVLDKSWVNVIADELQQTIPDNNCYTVLSWVFERFHGLLEFTPDYKKEDFLSDMLINMEKADMVTDFLLSSKFNYNQASKHPTPEGHTLWANYLFNKLKTQQEGW